MIKVESKGDFKKTEKFLTDIKEFSIEKILRQYGQDGVRALSSATPVKTGKTANSWGYEVHVGKGRSSLIFYNTNINRHVNIAIILQTGHGTGTGGYVSGRDYINPAIRPIFDKIADSAWKEVKGLG